jgi:class 3 adenylate cyclase
MSRTAANTAATDTAAPNPADMPFTVPVTDRLTYHFLIAVDIEGYSKLSTAQQKQVQQDLHQILETAAAAAGLDRRTWLRQVGGDGEMAILPPDTDGLLVLVSYPRALAAALAELNRERRPPIRLRVAMHHGPLSDGLFGAVGQAPIVVARLLDSQELRDELRADPVREMALIVSSSLYSDIVETGFEGLAPEEFHPVEITAKGASFPGRIHRGPR